MGFERADVLFERLQTTRLPPNLPHTKTHNGLSGQSGNCLSP